MHLKISKWIYLLQAIDAGNGVNHVFLENKHSIFIGILAEFNFLRICPDRCHQPLDLPNRSTY
jgi:hypothetical protein